MATAEAQGIEPGIIRNGERGTNECVCICACARVCVWEGVTRTVLMLSLSDNSTERLCALIFTCAQRVRQREREREREKTGGEGRTQGRRQRMKWDSEIRASGIYYWKDGNMFIFIFKKTTSNNHFIIIISLT